MMVACAFSVLMLLTFPARSAHQYTSHLRTPEVGQSIERHTSIARTNIVPAECVTHRTILPTLFVSVDDGDTRETTANSEIPPSIPISHLLLRMKLGSSRSGSQDPLL